MAFNKQYLAPIAVAGPDLPTVWMYKTTDPAATVDTASYFDVGLGLKLGDLIFRVTVDSLSAPTTATGGLHQVVNVSATAVDVADALALTATDTD